SVATVAPCGVLKALSPGFGTGYTSRAETALDVPSEAPSTPSDRPSSAGRTSHLAAAPAAATAIAATSGTPTTRTGSTLPHRSAPPGTPVATCSANAVWSYPTSLEIPKPRMKATNGATTSSIPTPAPDDRPNAASATGSSGIT